MKNLMLVITVMAMAIAMSGCRYNKAGSGTSTGATDAQGRDIASEDVTEGSLDSIGEKRFEDMYARCTDVEFVPVYFGFDSTVVAQGELSKVDAVARHLADKPERVVVVEGHCDERGSNEYNVSLGENRASIVRNYLVQSGIEEGRIQTRSYGEEKPAAIGNAESFWSKNRRDEFVIFDTSVKK
jgi:peptidoglycan-associated lipoprotein